MVKKEIALRIGEIHDTLQAIRVGIGNKSFAFRGKLRHARYKTQNTRAWDTIHALDNSLGHHRHVYNSPIQALRSLRADREVMDQFQEIHAKDMNASTIVMDPNAAGQRNKLLPWFWNSIVSTNTKDEAILTECKCPSASNW